MSAAMAGEAAPARPQHRRNASSRSNIFRALVPTSSRGGNGDSDSSTSRQQVRTQTVPILPPDHPHAAKSKVLGERHGNTQSSPKPQLRLATSTTNSNLMTLKSPSKKSREPAAGPKKSKSSTNLAGVFSRMNRSSKDLSAGPTKDKENTTPPSSSHGPAHTPIWAQFSKAERTNSRPSTRGSETSISVADEIAKYTPDDYSPSKQRNFNGSFDQPQLRPKLSARPQSMYVMGTDIISAVGRRVSGDKSSLQGRKSEELDGRKSQERGRRVSGEKMFEDRRMTSERKTSGSSAEQPAASKGLNVAKRGGRVMAAVAALQGKSQEQPSKRKVETPLDPQAIDHAFEGVLESRNIPEPMRQKMRSLTTRVKADFVKQDQEASRISDLGGTASQQSTASRPTTASETTGTPAEDSKEDDQDAKSTKRSRSRSRTFTFSKGDKRGDASPSKKHRSSSKGRSTNGQDTRNISPTTPSAHRASLDKRRSGGPAVPADFISYLRNKPDPVDVEVGRLHKLRILVRNETVAWVDCFVAMGGMKEIVDLLHRIITMEWRDEHEDQLLHETLLCLKGLCTTERAIEELEKVADKLFPALIGMLFDDEKKGPAEYTTRTIIITVLYNFLSTAVAASPEALEQRARKILSYLAEPSKPEDSTPVDFVLEMRISRPYKLWCREISHVTKEVFWIFLHHLNVVPLPKASQLTSTANVDPDPGVDVAERSPMPEASFARRHFPGIRAPVPAAPYIGGVEWDATTYITAHLDLMNGLLASLPSTQERNSLRAELRASGLEKVLGTTLRTCKEKFYSGVHDGLRVWVAAAAEDGWDTTYVREGPSQEEQARGYSPKKSPVKKKEAPPKIAVPQLESSRLDLGSLSGGFDKAAHGLDNGWLG